MHGPLVPELLATLRDSGPSPDERLLRSERLELLRSLVARLEPEQQHLLALRYGAGLGFDEIAQVLAATPGALRVRVHRILEELRRRYPHDDA